jgi:hypothetical protein
VVGPDDACNGVTKLVLLGVHSSPESVNGKGVDESGNGLESLGIKSAACVVSMSGKGGPINKDGESVGGGGAGIADTETLDVVVMASGGAVVVVVLDDGKLTVEEGGEVVVVEGHGSLALVVAEDVDGEVAVVGAIAVGSEVVDVVVVLAGFVVLVVVLDDCGVRVVDDTSNVVVVEGHGSLTLVVGPEDVDGKGAVVGAVELVVGRVEVVVEVVKVFVVVVLDDERFSTVDVVVVEGHVVVLVSVVVVGVVGQDPAHVTGKR